VIMPRAAAKPDRRRALEFRFAAQFSSPSRTLLRFAKSFSREFPVLDAGCGFGRNAVALAKQALTVVCADRDEQRLGELMRLAPANQLRGARVELAPAELPQAGELYRLLAPRFRFEHYEERPVGPARSNKRARARPLDRTYGVSQATISRLQPSSFERAQASPSPGEEMTRAIPEEIIARVMQVRCLYRCTGSEF
jgi:hypothetical protein